MKYNNCLEDKTNRDLEAYAKVLMELGIAEKHEACRRFIAYTQHHINRVLVGYFELDGLLDYVYSNWTREMDGSYSKKASDRCLAKVCDDMYSAINDIVQDEYCAKHTCSHCGKVGGH